MSRQYVQRADGIIETLLGVASLHVDANAGTAEYGGETEMCWDTQIPLEDESGQVTLMCTDGHEWQAKMQEDEEIVPTIVPR